MKNKILLFNEKNIELKNSLSSYNNDINESLQKNEKLEKMNQELKNDLTKSNPSTEAKYLAKIIKKSL